jgi:hypothetical protein
MDVTSQKVIGRGILKVSDPETFDLSMEELAKELFNKQGSKEEIIRGTFWIREPDTRLWIPSFVNLGDKQKGHFYNELMKGKLIRETMIEPTDDFIMEKDVRAVFQCGPQRKENNGKFARKFVGIFKFVERENKPNNCFTNTYKLVDDTLKLVDWRLL